MAEPKKLLVVALVKKFSFVIRQIWARDDDAANEALWALWNAANAAAAKVSTPLIGEKELGGFLDERLAAKEGA
jgi:hypothetical protein